MPSWIIIFFQTRFAVYASEWTSKEVFADGTVLLAPLHFSGPKQQQRPRRASLRPAAHAAPHSAAPLMYSTAAEEVNLAGNYVDEVRRLVARRAER